MPVVIPWKHVLSFIQESELGPLRLCCKHWAQLIPVSEKGTITLAGNYSELKDSVEVLNQPQEASAKQLRILFPHTYSPPKDVSTFQLVQSIELFGLTLREIHIRTAELLGHVLIVGCVALKAVEVTGCPSLQSISIRACPKIEYSGLLFLDDAILNKRYQPCSTLLRLELTQLPLLSSVRVNTCDYPKLRTLRLINCQDLRTLHFISTDRRSDEAASEWRRPPTTPQSSSTTSLSGDSPFGARELSTYSPRTSTSPSIDRTFNRLMTPLRIAYIEPLITKSIEVVDKGSQSPRKSRLRVLDLRGTAISAQSAVALCRDHDIVYLPNDTISTEDMDSEELFEYRLCTLVKSISTHPKFTSVGVTQQLQQELFPMLHANSTHKNKIIALLLGLMHCDDIFVFCTTCNLLRDVVLQTGYPEGLVPYIVSNSALFRAHDIIYLLEACIVRQHIDCSASINDDEVIANRNPTPLNTQQQLDSPKGFRKESIQNRLEFSPIATRHRGRSLLSDTSSDHSSLHSFPASPTMANELSTAMLTPTAAEISASLQREVNVLSAAPHSSVKSPMKLFRKRTSHDTEMKPRVNTPSTPVLPISSDLLSPRLFRHRLRGASFTSSANAHPINDYHKSNGHNHSHSDVEVLTYKLLSLLAEEKWPVIELLDYFHCEYPTAFHKTVDHFLHASDTPLHCGMVDMLLSRCFVDAQELSSAIVQRITNECNKYSSTAQQDAIHSLPNIADHLRKEHRHKLSEFVSDRHVEPVLRMRIHHFLQLFGGMTSSKTANRDLQQSLDIFVDTVQAVHLSKKSKETSATSLIDAAKLFRSVPLSQVNAQLAFKVINELAEMIFHTPEHLTSSELCLLKDIIATYIEKTNWGHWLEAEMAFEKLRCALFEARAQHFGFVVTYEVISNLIVQIERKQRLSAFTAIEFPTSTDMEQTDSESETEETPTPHNNNNDATVANQLEASCNTRASLSDASFATTPMEIHPVPFNLRRLTIETTSPLHSRFAGHRSFVELNGVTEAKYPQSFFADTIEDRKANIDTIVHRINEKLQSQKEAFEAEQRQRDTKMAMLSAEKQQRIELFKRLLTDEMELEKRRKDTEAKESNRRKLAAEQQRLKDERYQLYENQLKENMERIERELAEEMALNDQREKERKEQLIAEQKQVEEQIEERIRARLNAEATRDEIRGLTVEDDKEKLMREPELQKRSQRDYERSSLLYQQIIQKKADVNRQFESELLLDRSIVDTQIAADTAFVLPPPEEILSRKDIEDCRFKPMTMADISREIPETVTVTQL